VVRYENRYFQLERTSDYPPRQAKITVCEWEDGRIEIRYPRPRPGPIARLKRHGPAEQAIRLIEKPPKTVALEADGGTPLGESPALLQATACASP